MKTIYILLIMFVPLIASANSVCEQKEQVAFSCELEGQSNTLSACYNNIDNTMYFSIYHNGERVIYKPYLGMGLEEFNWVDVSMEAPEYIPLKFKIDNRRNAYFSMTRGGVRLSIMDSKLMHEDENDTTYFCKDDSYSAFDPNTRLKIKHIEPNQFEKWD